MVPDASFAAAPARPAAASAGQVASPNGNSGGKQDDGQGEGFFSELWDIINPLQHLPVIGTAYRAITGQHMDGFARVAGDALYGGLWGAVTAVADEAFEAITGKTVEDTVLSWLDLDSGSGSGSGAAVRVAAADVEAPRLDPAAIKAAPPSVFPLPASSPTPSQPAPVPARLARGPVVGPAGLAALSNALAEKGVTGATAKAALYAYRQSIALTGAGAPFAVN